MLSPDSTPRYIGVINSLIEEMVVKLADETPSQVYLYIHTIYLCRLISCNVKPIKAISLK
jgi:hypothetical protein